MKATHLKAEIGPDGKVVLPGGPWTPGPVEIIILQRDFATSRLLEFAGTLEDQQAAAIKAAALEDCETIDVDTW